MSKRNKPVSIRTHLSNVRSKKYASVYACFSHLEQPDVNVLYQGFVKEDQVHPLHNEGHPRHTLYIRDLYKAAFSSANILMDNDESYSYQVRCVNGSTYNTEGRIHQVYDCLFFDRLDPNTDEEKYISNGEMTISGDE